MPEKIASEEIDLISYIRDATEQRVTDYGRKDSWWPEGVNIGKGGATAQGVRKKVRKSLCVKISFS